MQDGGAVRAGATVRVRLWDGPTRLVHWALVVVLGFSWWSAENDHLQWHRWSGYAVVGLVAFRLLWGFAGSASARFSRFVKGPAATLAYLQTLPRRMHEVVPGHNPLGAWSVVAILLVLVAQTVTGLFAVDIDAFEAGPLSDRVDFDTGRLFAKWHHWSFTTLQVLVVLHLAAVAFYLFYKRANLIGPMITGYRRFRTDPGLVFAPLWRAVVATLVAAAFAWWVSKGFRM
jgi:cytochrome b